MICMPWIRRWIIWSLWICDMYFDISVTCALKEIDNKYYLYLLNGTVFHFEHFNQHQILIIIIIMGRMGICFTSMATSWWGDRGMLPIIMLPVGDLRIALHLVPFWILTIWGSVHIEETVVGVTNFGWKPPLHNSWNFISQRSTSHATQSFITPGEPQFPQLFCPRVVQLLAGIISLRRVRGPNPGRSHGSAHTLPLRGRWLTGPAHATECHRTWSALHDSCHQLKQRCHSINEVFQHSGQLLSIAASTYWDWYKMAAIFQTTFPNTFSWLKIKDLIKISPKLVSADSIDCIPALA